MDFSKKCGSHKSEDFHSNRNLTPNGEAKLVDLNIDKVLLAKLSDLLGGKGGIEYDHLVVRNCTGLVAELIHAVSTKSNVSRFTFCNTISRVGSEAVLGLFADFLGNGRDIRSLNLYFDSLDPISSELWLAFTHGVHTNESLREFSFHPIDCKFYAEFGRLSHSLLKIYCGIPLLGFPDDVDFQDISSSDATETREEQDAIFASSIERVRFQSPNLAHARPLSSQLFQNWGLKGVYLCGFEVDEECLIDLASFCCRSRCLEELELVQCRVSAHGLCAFAKRLPLMASLMRLVITAEIPMSVHAAFLSGLIGDDRGGNTRLKTLELSGAAPKYKGTYQFYTDLNRKGYRKPIHSLSPTSFVNMMLHKADGGVQVADNTISHLYYYLRRTVEIWKAQPNDDNSDAFDWFIV